MLFVHYPYLLLGVVVVSLLLSADEVVHRVLQHVLAGHEAAVVGLRVLGLKIRNRCIDEVLSTK